MVEEPHHPGPQVSRLEDQAVIHLYWDIHCIPKECIAPKKLGEGLDYKITLKNANTHRYQKLVNEFNYVMENVVNEVLGDTDPNDHGRFAILSSNLARALNTMCQPLSEVTGVYLAELFCKMLQSNQYFDIDNDLTLHVQRVNLPRGNGRNIKLAVNMGLNILLKICEDYYTHNKIWHTCKSEYNCIMCKEKACLCKQSYKDYVKNVLVFFSQRYLFQPSQIKRATSCEVWSRVCRTGLHSHLRIILGYLL